MRRSWWTQGKLLKAQRRERERRCLDRRLSVGGRTSSARATRSWSRAAASARTCASNPVRTAADEFELLLKVLRGRRPAPSTPGRATLRKMADMYASKASASLPTALRREGVGRTLAARASTPIRKALELNDPRRDCDVLSSMSSQRLPRMLECRPRRARCLRRESGQHGAALDGRRRLTTRLELIGLRLRVGRVVGETIDSSASASTSSQGRCSRASIWQPRLAGVRARRAHLGEPRRGLLRRRGEAAAVWRVPGHVDIDMFIGRLGRAGADRIPRVLQHLTRIAAVQMPDTGRNGGSPSRPQGLQELLVVRRQGGHLRRRLPAAPRSAHPPAPQSTGDVSGTSTSTCQVAYDGEKVSRRRRAARRPASSSPIRWSRPSYELRLVKLTARFCGGAGLDRPRQVVPQGGHLRKSGKLLPLRLTFEEPRGQDSDDDANGLSEAEQRRQRASGSSGLSSTHRCPTTRWSAAITGLGDGCRRSCGVRAERSGHTRRAAPGGRGHLAGRLRTAGAPARRSRSDLDLQARQAKATAVGEVRVAEVTPPAAAKDAAEALPMRRASTRRPHSMPVQASTRRLKSKAIVNDGGRGSCMVWASCRRRPAPSRRRLQVAATRGRRVPWLNEDSTPTVELPQSSRCGRLHADARASSVVPEGGGARTSDERVEMRWMTV